MTSKVFTKLFGLFVLLLVLQTVVVELVFSRMAGGRFRLPGHEALWPGLIALGVALTTQCPYCLEIHRKAAEAAGATQQELAETAMVAAALRAGAAVTHATHILGGETAK